MLTIRQPWVWAIFHAGKDVENRTRHLAYRGLLGVSASVRRSFDSVAWRKLRADGFDVPEPDELPTGVLYGTLYLHDCVRGDSSRWAEADAWHLQLRFPIVLGEPVPHRGYPWLHYRELS